MPSFKIPSMLKYRLAQCRKLHSKVIPLLWLTSYTHRCPTQLLGRHVPISCFTLGISSSTIRTRHCQPLERFQRPISAMQELLGRNGAQVHSTVIVPFFECIVPSHFPSAELGRCVSKVNIIFNRFSNMN